MELFVGAAVVLGWAVIELVILRRDKRRAAEEERRARAAGESASAPEPSRVRELDRREDG